MPYHTCYKVSPLKVNIAPASSVTFLKVFVDLLFIGAAEPGRWALVLPVSDILAAAIALSATGVVAAASSWFVLAG